MFVLYLNSISGSHDHKIRVWSRAAFTCTWVVRGHLGPILNIVTSTKHVFSTSTDLWVQWLVMFAVHIYYLHTCRQSYSLALCDMSVVYWQYFRVNFIQSFNTSLMFIHIFKDIDFRFIGKTKNVLFSQNVNLMCRSYHPGLHNYL